MSPETHDSRPGDVAKKTRDAFRTVSMSSVGLEMGFAVLIGLLGGRFLDARIGTAPWLLIIGTILGMAAGIIGVMRAFREADRAAKESGK